MIREFSARGNYYLNGHKENIWFRGNWWSNSLGVNARINKKHDLHVEVDSNLGHKFESLQIQAGYRDIF